MYSRLIKADFSFFTHSYLNTFLNISRSAHGYGWDHPKYYNINFSLKYEKKIRSLIGENLTLKSIFRGGHCHYGIILIQNFPSEKTSCPGNLIAATVPLFSGTGFFCTNLLWFNEMW